MYYAYRRILTFQDNRLVRFPYVAEYSWFGGIEEKVTGFVDEYIDHVASVKAMVKVYQ